MGSYKSLVIEICDMHESGMENTSISTALDVSYEDVTFVTKEYYDRYRD